MTAVALKYDDSRLRRMWKDMSPAYRKKAMKGALRLAGNKVKKSVILQARSATTKHGKFKYNSKMNRGVKVKVGTKAISFSVSISTAGKWKSNREGYYRNHRGIWVPDEVLMWICDGTDVRFTGRGIKERKLVRLYNNVTGEYIRSKWHYVHKDKHYRGRIERTDYVKKAQEASDSEVRNDLSNALVQTIEKTAKKYGCE